MLNPKILQIDGWMTPGELNWLYQTSCKIPHGGLIVEMGVWKGRASAALYQGAENDKTVISIDTWEGHPDLIANDHQEARQTDLFAVYLNNMKKIGFNPIPYSDRSNSDNGLYYIIGDSAQSANLFVDKSVDLAFIDTDQCADEIDAWLPKMKEDGVISGHDYLCFYERIQQEIHKRFFVHQLVESIWIRYIGDKPPWL